MKYLKTFGSFSLIQEGVINLTQKEEDQLEEIVDRMWEIMEKDDYTKADKTIPGPIRKLEEGPVCSLKAWEVGVMNYEYAGGGHATLRIYLGDPTGTEADGTYAGFYSPADFNDPHDNIIYMNKLGFKSHDATTKNKLHSVLFHEIIHAKDPKCNKYQKIFDRIGLEYEERDEEISAHKSQFFNLIERRINLFIKENDNNLNDKILPAKLKKIEFLLGSFFKTFSALGRGGIANQQIIDFIERGELNLNDQDKDDPNGFLESEILNLITYFLRTFKALDKRGESLGPRYKKFLSDFYVLINRCQDKVNKMIEGTELNPIDYRTSGKNFIYVTELPDWMKF